MKPSILITRPSDEAQDFAAAVTELGFDSVIEPLLKIELLRFANSPACPTVVVTSPQVFKNKIPALLQDTWIYVMGEASAREAQLAGFKNIIISQGNFNGLIERVRKDVPAGQDILYLRGETIRHDLKAALPEHQIYEQIVYKAEPAQELSPDVIEHIRTGKIQIVTLFSPRSAAIFMELIQAAGLDTSIPGIKLLCLSGAVLESVQSLPWREVRVAAQPDQTGMLVALQGWRT